LNGEEEEREANIEKKKTTKDYISLLAKSQGEKISPGKEKKT